MGIEHLVLLAYLVSVGCIGLAAALINDEGCGIRVEDALEGRIIGGKKSTSEWPWMATIFKEGRHACGGSVLDRRHVVTAAHCVEGNDDPRNYTVSFGELETKKGLSYRIEKIISHEEYSQAPLFFNDIALLILQNPLPTDVIPICLPEEDTIRDDETLTITGFGTIIEGGKPSPTLNEVDGIPYINPDKCNEILDRLFGGKAFVTEQQLCTSDDAGGRGSCQGDSGGPVMHQQADGRWSLVGLVSYSIGCVRPGIPTVHTRLHAYRDWIQTNMLVK